MATFQLPVESRGFRSIGGFFEQFTMKVQLHEYHRSRSYGLVAGEGWRSMNTVTVRTNKPGAEAI
jgi:hypothetical protein